MTCIVGLVTDKAIYIGGDSAGSNGWRTRAVTVPKVFHYGDFLIGYTGSFRFGQLLQTGLSVPHQTGDEGDGVYMVTQFAEKTRELLKERGFSTVENNQESGGFALIGYRGRLYMLQSDFSVIEHADKFDAIGCGENYALAAMKALEDMPPKRRIKRALSIAAYFSDGVCKPFTVEMLRRQND